MAPDNLPRLCFIGFGEAGQAFASGLQEAGVTHLSAWDILFPEPAGERLRQAAKALGVSTTTANRYWTYARAWLHEELKSDK